MYLSIGGAAELLGVSITTLRRWDKEKYLEPDYITKGKHRRYSLKRLKKDFLDIEESHESRVTFCYARVSSHDQKEDLKRQEDKLISYCQSNEYKHFLISDLGSGIKYDKRGLLKLIRLILSNKIERLVLTHRDRLLRFGSQLLFNICEYFDVEVEIIEDTKSLSFEQSLACDVIEIMTVFTAKLYGRRSHKNKTLNT